MLEPALLGMESAVIEFGSGSWRGRIVHFGSYVDGILNYARS
jgi:hypothetical protein